MPKAIWNGEIIAEAKEVEKKDGYMYFPKKSLKRKFIKDSPKHFVDMNKGTANFYNIVVEDKINWNGAWYYPEPREPAKEIKGFVGFSPDVEVVEK